MNVIQISFFHLVFFINVIIQKEAMIVMVSFLYFLFFVFNLIHSGETFYQQVPKTSTLAVLILTGCIFAYKEMYGFASIAWTTSSVLLILFAKNLL